MRTSVFGLFLLASVASAQPSAADSALVERTIVSLRLDLATAAFENMGAGFEGMAGAMGPDAFSPLATAFAEVDLEGVGDSVRVAFYQDLQPEMLEQALVYLEGAAPQRIIDQALFTVGEPIDFAEIEALIEDPGDLPLADSMLTVRYTDAMWEATVGSETQTMIAQHMFDAMLNAMPSSIRQEFQQAIGGDLEGLMATFSGDMMSETMRPMMVRSNRLMLGSVDQDAIEATAAYYESDAGRYVSERSMEGSTRSLLPVLIQGMTDSLRPLFAQIAAMEKDQGPYPVDVELPSNDGPLSVVEVEPELIGGLEGVQRRVVYPEGAQAEGVEGQVVIQFTVGTDGVTRDFEVLRSPDDRLSDAALEAVRASRFKPGRDGGKLVAVRFSLPVTFRLQ